MPFLDIETTNYVKEQFVGLKNPVKFILFTSELNCEYCDDTERLLKELVETSGDLSLQVYNLHADAEIAKKYNIDKTPAIVIEGAKDYGIRFFGIPSGYEFGSLIEDVIDVSNGSTDLPSFVKEKIQKIDKPVHLQVFVTPSCPYCPGSVRFAHQLAIENDFITADMVEAQEFSEISMKYRVQGVPKTVINETTEYVGRLPEQQAINFVMKAYEEVLNHPARS
jgi:glutaredoxin-like protein